jgi:hypothetical protein
MTGLPYFANGGKDKTGRPIEDADPKKSLLASIASNAEGRNLQGWNKALVTSAPPTGTLWEQMLGRLHREGQTADEVTYEVMVSCREQLAGFEQAMRDANFHADLLGSDMKMASQDLRGVVSLDLDLSPRTSYADIIVPAFHSRGWAWREPARKDPNPQRLGPIKETGT